MIYYLLFITQWVIFKHNHHNKFTYILRFPDSTVTAVYKYIYGTMTWWFDLLKLWWIDDNLQSNYNTSFFNCEKKYFIFPFSSTGKVLEGTILQNQSHLTLFIHFCIFSVLFNDGTLTLSNNSFTIEWWINLSVVNLRLEFSIFFLTNLVKLWNLYSLSFNILFLNPF